MITAIVILSQMFRYYNCHTFLCKYFFSMDVEFVCLDALRIPS